MFTTGLSLVVVLGDLHLAGRRLRRLAGLRALDGLGGCESFLGGLQGQVSLPVRFLRDSQSLLGITLGGLGLVVGGGAGGLGLQGGGHRVVTLRVGLVGLAATDGQNRSG